MFNPFPGLRPFEPDEEHLFFGREAEIDDLLRRLRSSRFVAVIGTSGSGKSSLVRSGLIPSLQSGFMAGAGSSWRIAMFRPGEDPIGHLAAALDAPDVLGNPELGDTSRVLLEVTLRRSTLGLGEAVRQARLPAGENVLVIVDQFEELFRFRESRNIANSRDEAIAFVKLLLEATSRPGLNLYVVLTMRSDFIGDCMNFPGLPEAVNAGLYLVGRMSRDGVRAAITGPIAVAGGRVAPRLVNRVLNDLGDDHDQLPLVQHALMRTWDHWAARETPDAELDVADYEAIGTFRDALSKHAEEAYSEAAALGLATLAERIFKALTDTFSDRRGVRRPTALGDLAAICQASEDDVTRTVEIFRRPGRSFLMPPAGVPLGPASIIDLSHESLMRCWGRLITWAEQERAAARFYLRLSQAAQWFDQGTAGLWRNPELELAQRWMADNHPTKAWAERYDAGYDLALRFLERSLAERDRLAAEVDRERRAKLRRTQLVAGVLALLLAVAGGLGAFAWAERQRAQANLDLAREAVDESLAAADRDPAEVGADVPQVEELRRELLAKAERFYVTFMRQEPRSERARRDLALAHLRLGHINRMLDKRTDAEREYREAVAGLTTLAAGRDARRDDRQALALAHNWLGETLRPQAGRAEDAMRAYDEALQLQRALVADWPEAPELAIELARTLSNRGILRSRSASTIPAAATDFRDAIARLQPLTASQPLALQELGRVSNNLAALLDTHGGGDARPLYEQAVAGHERLVREHPEHREYQLELATFVNNLAVFLHEVGADEPAAARSRQAVAIMTALARPASSLAIERADAHNLYAMIVEETDALEAERAYDRALILFAELQHAPGVFDMRAFHIRFTDLILNIAAFVSDAPGDSRRRRLLERGVEQFAGVGRQIAESGTESQAGIALESVTLVIDLLEAGDARLLLPVQEQLRRAATGG